MRNCLLIAIILLFAGCSKDKFGTTPTLKFEDVNTTTLTPGSLLQFKLSFTDKEGDISNSIYVKKIVPGCENSGFEQEYSVPSFPSTVNQKGELLISFSYNYDIAGYPDVKGPQCDHDDTATFQFVLKDVSGHTSDTITSPPILILQ